MDKTQLGRAGELALALYALVGTDGELQLYTPVADDDHTDVTIGRRGLVPAIALQVKSTAHLDRTGQVEAEASYPAGRVREFRTRPTGNDQFAPYLVPPLELGSRLLKVIDSLQARGISLPPSAGGG